MDGKAFQIIQGRAIWPFDKILFVDYHGHLYAISPQVHLSHTTR